MFCTSDTVSVLTPSDGCEVLLIKRPVNQIPGPLRRKEPAYVYQADRVAVTAQWVDVRVREWEHRNLRKDKGQSTVTERFLE